MNYNKKLSGAKLVLVPLMQMGRNMLPYVEDLKDRYIKYIDCFPTDYLPETDKAGCNTTIDLSLTLSDKTGNQYLIKDMPLERFCYADTMGSRQPVLQKISLQNSYITCANEDVVGKTVALVFWYDLPEYSRANKSELTITDSLSIPITTTVRHNLLPDEERMSGKRFRRLLLGIPETTPDYQAGLTAAQLANVYITLRKGSYNVVENLPIMLLYQLTMLEKSEFANIVFDLQSSFLTIGGADTIADRADYIGKVIFMNMVYEK